MNAGLSQNVRRQGLAGKRLCWLARGFGNIVPAFALRGPARD